MKLNDPLVESFEFRGEIYSINLSFNKVLDVFDVIDDDFLNEAEKCFLCLDILLDRTDLPFTYAVDLWVYIKTNFIDVERPEKPQLDIKGNPMPVVKEKEDNKKVIDLSLDAEFIYASFRQAYQINLLKEQNRLSWIEFKALLNALPDDTVMQRIIAIRQWEDDGEGSKKYRDNMRKLKAKYSLDDGEEEDDGS
ncbi:TPA: bacteriophage Gp15 family protein [Streptococcus pyogenes]|uniref:Phage Gp15 protein n=1 Tax=Streptococcus pyogenes TaxID=1314 RepID=A0A660A4T3_STRPY|nr:bacteriophage Gp15 family protein [Streptococcus pyogenes]HER4545087.1 bacteriophage Gp15 family protein [Streptococcus pyogenes NGAS675]HER4548615.1 bacteriophage Gp15 family protein [Streptococcus pyogenes NGAS670]HER4636742.1 bacteriophage Gp15 family protein [Streptococcus pyogenes NGAS510]HER4685816.1 bacteriophage Gp15 family protein [Streptococcus pyogenes NGAS353]HER4760310.1 bacteriophage Gp15 family protein [Streptococcus pyogenes NGAS245]HER4810803.1 bacteriophage Gp15 family pr